ncbi:MAG: MerR family transcriptional regulator [Clostridiales bacterium]|nr:MerR family transcriptional regulator [Clostridiales bacterium]
MELRNCANCGRAFAYIGSDLCSRCGDSDEDDFKKVKLYLYDHPGATIREVSEETGVEERKILRFLKEDRIEIVEEDNLILACERCGNSIKSGRFCNPCAAKLQKEFKQVIEPLAKKEEKEPIRNNRSNKMHVAEIRKNLGKI